MTIPHFIHSTVGRYHPIDIQKNRLKSCPRRAVIHSQEPLLTRYNLQAEPDICRTYHIRVLVYKFPNTCFLKINFLISIHFLKICNIFTWPKIPKVYSTQRKVFLLPLSTAHPSPRDYLKKINVIYFCDNYFQFSYKFGK